MITLLDYGAGNVRSVINAIERLGESVRVVASTEDILSAEKLVFPGVGAFGSMMSILNEHGFVDPLNTISGPAARFWASVWAFRPCSRKAKRPLPSTVWDFWPAG